MTKPSVSTFLAQVRQQLAELPAALSGALLLSAVRLSEGLQQALDPDGLKVTESGQLELERLGALREPYAAPELLKGAAPPRDPRVLVYSAGALGYELVMLRPLSGEPGPELGGPFADVIRRALSRDRDRRFRNLAEMARAIEAIQAPPSDEEERLILAAIAETGGAAPAEAKAPVAPPSPPARRKPALVPEPPPAPQARAGAPELLADRWDPVSPSAPPPPLGDPDLVVLHPSEALEARNPVTAPPAIVPVRPAEDVRALVAAEARSRKDELAAIESKLAALARVGAKVATFEQRLREITVPPAGAQAPASLARKVKELVEERRFEEAEAALRVPALASDPLLQLRLGQVLSARPDLPPARSGEIEAAFRRAADLDPAWPLPRALLGARLLRCGRKREGEALLREALALDPACAEALLALRPPAARRSVLMLAGGAALGAIAVALVLPLVLRSMEGQAFRGVRPLELTSPGEPALKASVQSAETQAESHEAASAPSPAPTPVQATPAAPARQATTPPAEAPPKRSRRVASAGGNRGAALEAVARGDKAVRAFDTGEALKAFQAALKLDASLPAAHRGLGMVYVLQGHNAEAKAEYRRYLELAPDASDRPQIERLLSH